MLITMKETMRGSQDGIHVETFKKGITYNIADSLANVFLENKWATLASSVTADKPQPIVEKQEAKMVEPEYENKALKKKGKKR